MSSLTPCVQNAKLGRTHGLVTVIVIVLVLWPAATEAVGAYVDAVALATVLLGTAAMYRNRSNHT
ncbi:hypothetical protein ACIGHB_10495 [Streptomyces sp. NPDC085460]|uniref:hypothetical protein n=1 Tax=Streptomyces sp. NPDC085460 TaxID=3365723 RepID=UPI0037D88CF3